MEVQVIENHGIIIWRIHEDDNTVATYDGKITVLSNNKKFKKM